MHLKDYLHETGKTYREFGDEIGCHISQVCRWANGQRIPDLETALIIERATAGRVTARDFIAKEAA